MVVALQKERVTGEGAYTRPPEIEAALEILTGLPISDLIERARIADRAHPLYIPSECLLHVFRKAGRQETLSTEVEQLFLILRRRVLRALPPVERYTAGDQRPSESASAAEVRDAVLFRFQQLLCQDRLGYEANLDFFEIRFDQAVARLRLTARKQGKRREDRSAPLFADEKSDEPSHEVEAALARLQQDPVEKLNAEDYRRRLLAAIDTLPDQERRVINLLLKDIPIDSKDPNATTIVGILNCSEKTVRNRRDRAYNMLRPFLGLPVSND